MALLAETFTVFILQRENKMILNNKNLCGVHSFRTSFLSWLRICLLCKIN